MQSQKKSWQEQEQEQEQEEEDAVSLILWRDAWKVLFGALLFWAEAPRIALNDSWLALVTVLS